MRHTIVLEADTGEIESDIRLDEGLLTTQNLYSQIGLCAPEWKRRFGTKLEINCHFYVPMCKESATDF